MSEFVDYGNTKINQHAVKVTQSLHNVEVDTIQKKEKKKCHYSKQSKKKGSQYSQGSSSTNTISQLN